MFRSQMITVDRGRFGTAATQVVEVVRPRGPVTREEVARLTGLSPATVKRTVAALVDAGVLRWRHDRTVPGQVGRPGIPVDLDTSRYVTLGLHLGRRVATVAVGDLRGQVLEEHNLDRRPDAAPPLGEYAEVAAGLLARLPGRSPLAASVVAPWADLELDRHAVGTALEDLLGLEVATADHIAAVAATEFLHRRHGTAGVTLYVYARNSVGFALAVDKGFSTEVSRVGSLTHFPVGSDAPCECGRTGCMEVTVGDHALLETARARRLLPENASVADLHARAHSGAGGLRDLLAERAAVLGRTAATVRDMTMPDRVVLVGQAFTDYPTALPLVVRAFEEHTSLGPAEVSFTRFGDGLQAACACTIALAPVYDDPLGVVPAPMRRPSQPSLSCPTRSA